MATWLTFQYLDIWSEAGLYDPAEYAVTTVIRQESQVVNVLRGSDQVNGET